MEVSRSALKKKMKQVEELVAELGSLPKQTVMQLPCPEELRAQFLAIASIKGGAKKRQIKYVTKLLGQEESLEELYVFLSKRRGNALLEKKQQQELESYRDALIEEALAQKEGHRAHGTDWAEDWPSLIVQEIKEHFPHIDGHALAKLAYLFAQTHNPRYTREIFRALFAAADYAQRTP